MTVGVTDVQEAPAVVPAVGVADAEGREGEDSAIVFQVTLDSAPSGPVTMHYATVDGTAVAGEDYEATSGTLTFAAGETEKTVSVTILDDAVEDSGETFRLVLTGPTGATLADGEAVGTILNTEPAGQDLPADTTTTGTVAVGGSATGTIENAGDRDWFAVELEAGVTYRVELEGSPTSHGTLGDTHLYGIYDSNGNLINGTQDGDGGSNWNSRVYYTADADGTYYISAGGFGSRVGIYQVSVTEVIDHSADTGTDGTVAVGGSAVVEIESESDRDWFAVTLEADRDCELYMNGPIYHE